MVPKHILQMDEMSRKIDYLCIYNQIKFIVAVAASSGIRYLIAIKAIAIL